MSVRVRISSAHKMAANGAEVVEVEGDTVAACIKNLISKYPALKKMMLDNTGEISRHILVSLNGVKLNQDELDKPVKAGDEIFPIIVIAGG